MPTPDARERELRDAIEALFFAYRAFTAEPDDILARRGLGRVHHRILYFVAREPGLSVTRLLEVLAVSKQALNTPLRQLSDSELIHSSPGKDDKRIRQLTLTAAGKRLESQLCRTQTALLDKAFESAGSKAEAGWREVMQQLARNER
ncbi:MarR family winged helix-turn-helix transcriptional regulator [Granulosicoccus sp. 3-233]|uniref:MarR family winged helix-turn-helix transcriptional regulator n=1 Tax=Granulosicoccus sp. 3-233 TaxID=3417969 RepID=UPI003D331433